MNKPEAQLGTLPQAVGGRKAAGLGSYQRLFAATALALASCASDPTKEQGTADMAGSSNPPAADLATGGSTDTPDLSVPGAIPDMTTVPPCSGLNTDTDQDGIPDYNLDCTVGDICPLSQGAPDIDGDGVCDNGPTLDRDTGVLGPKDDCVGDGSGFYNPIVNGKQGIAPACAPDLGGVDGAVDGGATDGAIDGPVLDGLPADAFSSDGAVDAYLDAAVDAGADLATPADSATLPDVATPVDLGTPDQASTPDGGTADQAKAADSGVDGGTATDGGPDGGAGVDSGAVDGGNNG